ncbi:PH domain-containing protein [Nonomuraea dietziae]|uniref:PH domain-containing protein n=1 Tax=Nonomuraea dietziae TaxID=65515 RepID=UPI0033DF4BF3
MSEQGATKLNPKVLLIDPVRMLPSLLIPLVGVLFVGGFSPRSFGWAAFGVLGTIVFAVVRWATFSYRIVGDRLEIKRSLISRSVRTIPLERVRGVDITTPPMHRLLGLAVLKIDTGASGGGEQEGELDGVSVAEAERLKDVLLRSVRAARAARAATGVDGGPEGHGSVAAPPLPEGEAVHRPGGASPDTSLEQPFEEPQEHVIVKVPRRWLLYGPLSGAFLFTPFAVAGGAIGLLFQWGDQLGLGRDAAWNAGRWVWDHPILIVVVVLALIVAMPFVAAVMYAVFNWDFTLKEREGYLVAERGLVTRRSVSLEARRTRGYEIVDALAERRAGVVRMWAIVTGLGDSETRGQLLPDVPRPVAVEVASQSVGPFTAPLRPHPPVARNRRLFRAIVPWLALAAVPAVLAVATATPAWWILAAVALVLAGLGVPLGNDRYRSLGHGYDGVRLLSVRSGSLRRSQAVIERRAVVGWRLRQTWFQRRAGVLTLVAGVGAGKGGYEAMDVSEEQGVAFPAEVTPEWLTPFLTRD